MPTELTTNGRVTSARSKAADTSIDSSSGVPTWHRAVRWTAASLFAGTAIWWAGSAALRGGAEPLPDAAEDKVLYVCTEDGHSFSLTPRELADARQRIGGTAAGVAPCPKCNKPTGQRAKVVDGKPVVDRELQRRSDEFGEVAPPVQPSR